ncbi:MAG: hypothetical protein QHI48_11720 [Bacteroidota bacterium]|nr:hypothetical protein [Bacteroidota bacterium]
MRKRNDTRIPILAAVSVLLVFRALPAGAQWCPLPYVNNPVCTAEGDQKNLDIVTDGRGGVIVVWEDDRNATTGADIYAQRISFSGSTLWGATGVGVCLMEGTQRRPRAVSDGRGGAFVVWEDARNGDYDIFLQRVDSTGAVAWSANGIPVCTAPWAQRYPVITADGLGGAYIVWQDSRFAGFAVYAQHVRSTGEILWGENGINVCPMTPSGVFPSAVHDLRGGVIVAWEDARDPRSGGDIYAQRLASDGTMQWSPSGVAVCTAPLPQKFPRMAPDGEGGAYIVWEDGRAGVADNDIYAQRVDSSGTARWLTNGVGVCTIQNDQRSPKIAADAAGGAVVAWRDARFAYSNRIFAQRISASGSMLWQSSGLDVCPSAQAANEFDLAADPAGGAVVVWQDERAGTANRNIFAQRLSATGNRSWDIAGAAVCTAVENQEEPLVVAAGNAGFIIGWRDYRNSGTSSDIFASFIDMAGVLTPVELVSFRAVEEEGGVRLSWTTLSESGNRGFYILRAAASPHPAWEVLGFVDADPVSTAGRSYEFFDADLPAQNGCTDLVYRLRQIDVDGATHDYPELSVRLGGGFGHLDLGIFPQPVNGKATVTYTSAEGGNARFVLFDMTGSRIASLCETVLEARCTCRFTLDMTPFRPGVYFLFVECGHSVSVRRVEVVR